MHLLWDLPVELLRQIVNCVAPNDLDNFMLYDERLREVAGSDLLHQHEINKVHFKRIGVRRTRHEFQELLQMFLCVPSKADYVKEMIARPWEFWRTVDPELEERTAPFSRWPHEGHARYSNPMMKAFEEAVNKSKSIPFEEKEHWISTIKIGNQNPVIALLLPRLHYLTYLELVPSSREDLFILKPIQRIVKDLGSPSLSRLREVKILGSARLTQRVELATACVALPSIVCVRAHGLVEGPLDSTETTYEMVPRSSCVRDIEIDDCRLSRDTLLNLTRAVKSKSLRSFKYAYYGIGDHPAFDWIYAALFQFSSKSLEELSLRRSDSFPLNSMGLDFKRFRKLRVLAIDYGLLMGNKFELTKKVVHFLPKSLEILDIYPCGLYFLQWVPQLVQSLARAKRNKLPCLKELNYRPTPTFPAGEYDTYPSIEEMRTWRTIAAEADFKMTVTYDVPDPWD